MCMISRHHGGWPPDATFRAVRVANPASVTIALGTVYKSVWRDVTDAHSDELRHQLSVMCQAYIQVAEA